MKKQQKREKMKGYEYFRKVDRFLKMPSFL